MRYIFLILVVLGLTSCGGNNAVKRTPSIYKEGEIIVKFKPGVREAQKYSAHDAVSAKSIKEIGPGGFEKIRLARGITVEAAIDAYRGNPAVEYAEPNYIVKAAAVPDDKRFSEQWGLLNTGQVVNGLAGNAGADIDAAGAWDLIKDSSVVIAVIDSGIDHNHPDLSANLVAGYDFVDNDNDPDDLNGHGTHVAGIIGAAGNNSIGVAGVNWHVKIMPLKVLDQNGEGTVADVIEAIGFAATNNAKIANMSFSGTDFSQALHDSIKQYPDILFIAAAGNDQSSTPEYPAGFGLPNIISVAATDRNDNLAAFSNYGASVNVAAPGTDILSTIPPFITAITYSGIYKIVYLSYGFECIRGSSAQTAVMQKILSVESVSPGESILLVDDDGGGMYETYYVQALRTLGYTFDIYEVPSNSDGPASARLNNYKLVIWFTGGESKNTLTQTDQVNLQSYLDNGGRLFMSGQDVGFDIGSSNFYQNYLHALYITDDALGAFYTGINSFDGLSVELESVCRDSASNQYLPAVDAVKPFGQGSSSAFYIQYNDAYQFLDGTSMSTPIVSGVAALVAAYYTDFNAVQIKGTILGSVDLKPSLHGKISSGGRVNAYRALASLVPASALNAAAQSGTTVVLEWTDNSTGETGFKIERKDDDGQFVQIATVAANQTTYTDRGLKGGRTYVYRVRAFNAVANSSYSNEASITLPGGQKSSNGSGDGCSIGAVNSYQTEAADTVVFLSPLIVIFIIKRLRKVRH